MQYKQIMDELALLGDEKRRKFNQKLGVSGVQFGVALGKLRPLALNIKTNHALALQLWESNNFDAMVLAAMLFDPHKLTESDIEKLIEKAYVYILVDEICFRTIASCKLAIDFMKKWIDKEDEKYGRGGWALACALILDDKLNEAEINHLLSQIEVHMKDALPLKQFMMNRCLCEIGIRYEQYTQRCLQIGEKLGVYQDLKVAKGCTSSYALEWIRVGLEKRRKGK